MFDLKFEANKNKIYSNIVYHDLKYFLRALSLIQFFIEACTRLKMLMHEAYTRLTYEKVPGITCYAKVVIF